MCGIFGMFLKRPLTPEDLERGRRSTQILAHRGPDGQGEWFDEAAGVFLGHRRLSIIDLSTASDQPFRLGERVLTYNGEIYNYQDVRRDLLDRGTEFRTNGDTEVLLQAWTVYGPAALDRFDGMFAFAVWDGQVATLAVDPFGEKPLYIAERDEGVYIASELRPLIEILRPQPSLDNENLLAYLALGYLPSPRTAWAGIRRLPAGHHATVSKGRVASTEAYWRPPLAQTPRGPVQTLGESDLDRIRDALVSSLERRYVADVPLCLFLSAGVDSSLLAALSVRELDRRPTCLTVAFPGSSVTNEAPLAAETAAYLGLEHREIASMTEPSDASERDVLDLLGQPNDNLTVLSVYQMCKAVQGGFKVGLTGMGGDEVFLGYGKHHILYRNRGFRALPDTLRDVLRVVGGGIFRLTGRSDNYLQAVLAPDHELYLGLKNIGALSWLHGLPGFEAWARRMFNWPGREAYLAVARYEISENMQCSQLLTIDHGSMRASMELRTPFLSREVLDVVGAYDPRAFMALEQKALLRRLLKRYLPEDVVTRPKAGFRFPPDRFVADRSQPNATDLGLPVALTAQAWSRRLTSPSWARIGVRLALAEAFIEQDHARSPAVSGRNEVATQPGTAAQ